MKIVIGNSRWRYVLLLLGSLAFVGGGLFILFMEYSGREGSLSGKMVGWSNVLFFGSCALIAAWQLFDSRPRLVIDDEGVLDRTLGVGRIPWADIQGAYLRSIAGNHFICLNLRDSDRYLRRTNSVKRALASANRSLGFTPISLNLSGVAGNSTDVLELIIRRIDKSSGIARAK